MAEEDDILSDADELKVVEELVTAQHKSHFLGLALKVRGDELQAIEQKYTDAKERLDAIIRKFLAQSDPLPTWRVIADALRNPLVDMSRLALTIERKYCPSMQQPSRSPREGINNDFNTCYYNVPPLGQMSSI